MAYGTIWRATGLVACASGAHVPKRTLALRFSAPLPFAAPSCALGSCIDFFLEILRGLCSYNHMAMYAQIFVIKHFRRTMWHRG
jgi:hypothetical protein